MIIIRDERSIGQFRDGMASLVNLGIGETSFLMENRIYDRCRRPHAWGEFGVGTRPGFPKMVEPFALALRAGTVPGGESGGFVKEEEFGVLSGSHDAVFPPFEFEQANDPPLALVETANLAVSIVQTTPVAHESATGGGGDEAAKRGDAVLAGHSTYFFSPAI